MRSYHADVTLATPTPLAIGLSIAKQKSYLVYSGIEALHDHSTEYSGRLSWRLFEDLSIDLGGGIARGESWLSNGTADPTRAAFYDDDATLRRLSVGATLLLKGRGHGNVGVRVDLHHLDHEAMPYAGSTYDWSALGISAELVVFGL
jgi:hypothetical protein